jgi:hypothetical protein
VSLSEVAGHDPAPLAHSAVVVEGVDFRPMVRAAALATGLALVVKVGVSLAMASRHDVTVEVRLYRQAFPYLAFLTARPQFLAIAAPSTLVMAVVVTLAYAVSLLRYRRRQYVAGWLVGPVAVLNVFVVDIIRHVVDPPYLLWRIERWTVLCIAVSALLTAAWLIVMRPLTTQGDEIPNRQSL